MIGTITRILAKAGYKAMNGRMEDEQRRLSGMEPPAAYVSYDPRLLGGAGWYGYRISLKGGDAAMRQTAMAMLGDLFTIREEYYRVDGITYTLGALLRQRVPHYGIGVGGSAPSPDDFWGLKLKMPEGGTVILHKGADTNAVSLEVSTDGANWQPWELVGNEYSYTLQAGETLCVRNTSETPTGFSSGDNKYYRFELNSLTYATGEARSLLVRDKNTAVSASSYVFRKLFSYCLNLITPPEINFSSYPGTYCFSAMFEKCGITKTPTLRAETTTNSMYREMFYGCSNLSEATTYMTTLGSLSLLMWMYGVAATGDFYCPASLTIPSGASGIPNGWTRHDIE